MMKNLVSAIAMLAMAGVTLIPAAPANAYQNGESCELKATSDGFVSLRKGPSVNTKRIRKLYSGQYRVAPIGPIGAWVKVIAGQSEGWSGKGYVRSNLVNWNACDNAG